MLIFLKQIVLTENEHSVIFDMVEIGVYIFCIVNGVFKKVLNCDFEIVLIPKLVFGRILKVPTARNRHAHAWCLLKSCVLSTLRDIILMI